MSEEKATPADRARDAYAEIDEVLKKHRCRIISEIRWRRTEDGQFEPVGAVWMVAPEK